MHGGRKVSANDTRGAPEDLLLVRPHYAPLVGTSRIHLTRRSRRPTETRWIAGCLRYRSHVERDDIQDAIRSAFVNVRLRSGVSLRHAESIDGTIFGLEPAYIGRETDEVTDDWTRVPESELLRDNIAHLDAEGLRYYLPALMLWLLDHYDEDRWLSGSDMTAIGTIGAVAPEQQFATTLWAIYDSFTAEQRTAIASYVEALPRLVRLDHEDARRVARSMDGYWRRFLPPSR
jgi:hypothetical protein